MVSILTHSILLLIKGIAIINQEPDYWLMIAMHIDTIYHCLPLVPFLLENFGGFGLFSFEMTDCLCSMGSSIVHHSDSRNTLCDICHRHVSMFLVTMFIPPPYLLFATRPSPPAERFIDGECCSIFLRS